jgi:fatty acid desaturase
VSDRQRPPLFWVLIVLLSGEFLLIAGLAVTLLIELLISTPASFPTAVALTVLAFAAISGAFSQPAWGWPLVAVALVTFLLLFMRPVVDATSHREERAS